MPWQLAGLPLQRNKTRPVLRSNLEPFQSRSQKGRRERQKVHTVCRERLALHRDGHKVELSQKRQNSNAKIHKEDLQHGPCLDLLTIVLLQNCWHCHEVRWAHKVLEAVKPLLKTSAGMKSSGSPSKIAHLLCQGIFVPTRAPNSSTGFRRT